MSMAVRQVDLLQGTLDLLVLKILSTAPNHGYGIAMRIHQLSDDALRVEEGSLYPALQKLLLKGWVKATWSVSDSGREVREYRITASGKKQLAAELADYRRVTEAIHLLLEKA